MAGPRTSTPARKGHPMRNVLWHSGMGQAFLRIDDERDDHGGSGSG